MGARVAKVTTKGPRFASPRRLTRFVRGERGCRRGSTPAVRIGTSTCCSITGGRRDGLRPARAGRACAFSGQALFDRVSQGSRVVDDTSVSGHNGDELRRLAEQLCCRKVDGIERADRFDRERSACTCPHGVRHCDDIAAASEPLQPAKPRALIGRRQASCDTSAHEGAGSFRKCQSGRNPPPPATQRSSRHGVLLEERGQQGAGLDVSECRGGRVGCFGGRRTASSAASRLSRSTARHDRYRSTRQQYQTVAGYPATPGEVHRASLRAR
jgi:hypothetical protein